MFRWLMRRGLAAFERKWNYDASYVHEMIEADPRAGWMFQRATSLGKYRKDVPVDALAAAAITAVRHEDCGPCTQLGVGFALRAGIPSATIAAVVEGDVSAMSAEVALGVRFARAVLARDAAADEHREEILRRWGPRALLALSFSMMAAQLYPALKYALGHGKACTRVVIAGQAVSPRHLATEAA